MDGVGVSRHYKNEAEVMLEENWRVRLEELSFGSHEKRGMTRTGSRVSLYRVRLNHRLTVLYSTQ